MLRKSLIALSLFGLSLSLLALPCAASDLTVYAGFVNPNAGLRTSPSFGASFDLPLANRFALEQRVGFLTQFPQFAATNTRTWGLAYNTTLSFNLPLLERVHPYAVSGIGFVSTLRDSLGIGTNFDFVYGGGLKLFDIGKRMGLRFEARGHRIVNLFGDRDINVFEFTIGPSFRLIGE